MLLFLLFVLLTVILEDEILICELFSAVSNIVVDMFMMFIAILVIWRAQRIIVINFGRRVILLVNRILLVK